MFLTFHKIATRANSKRIPAITLPTITPVGTSAFSWGFIIVMGICKCIYTTIELTNLAPKESEMV